MSNTLVKITGNTYPVKDQNMKQKENARLISKSVEPFRIKAEIERPDKEAERAWWGARIKCIGESGGSADIRTSYYRVLDCGVTPRLFAQRMSSIEDKVYVGGTEVSCGDAAWDEAIGIGKEISI